MKLYFGSTVTTVTTVMLLALLGFMGYSIVQMSSIGDAEACSCWYSALWFAALRQHGTDWTKPFSVPLMEAARLGYSRLSAYLPPSAASVH